jgi:flagellar FliL protein
MRKLLPILLALLGIAAGVGAGVVLKPGEDHAAAPCGEVEAAPETEVLDAPPELAHEYIKMNNQFVIPVVQDGKIGALVVLSLSLEVSAGSGELVYAREPKLRDAFLRAMFDHANAGGFDGEFTSNGNLAPLRAGLLAAAGGILGEAVSDVLIVDIVRQDN